MLRVDVLVIGGGIQGLLLLRRLSEAGYSCLLTTQGELGSGQTLHSHGLLNSGTGLLTGETHKELHDHVLPELERLGVPVYGEGDSFLSLPPPAVDQLAPLWQAHGYDPVPAPAPPDLRLPFEARRVPGFHVPKRGLVRALAEGFADRIVRGEVDATAAGYRLTIPGAAEPLEVAAQAVVVAAGAGTARALRERLQVSSRVDNRIGYVKIHMICLRGAIGALPAVGTILTPQLAVIGHVNRHHEDVGPEAQVSWYASPADPDPARFHDVPDDATAPVEHAAVRRGVELLHQLVPALADGGESVQATVFAGYKQDIDGQATRRLFEMVDDDRRIFVAVPSLLVNAWPNARDAAGALERLIGPRASDLGEPQLQPARIGDVNEHASNVAWRSWPAFAAAFAQ